MPKSKKPRKATAKKHLQGKQRKRKARARRDGFTAVRKQKFLGALGETGVVRDACRIAGISSTTAYRHARKDPEFAAAWEEAHASSLPTLEATA